MPPNIQPGYTIEQGCTINDVDNFLGCNLHENLNSESANIMAVTGLGKIHSTEMEFIALIIQGFWYGKTSVLL